ncbi:MAG: Exodeoxyribonuclease 7 small subunit [Thermoanaerobacterales bacterium 50_218]|nr:MAG: Exodeoxyribonuclease 7 small subunit [Thermoanaerobacterales bacterium 50_218]
MEEQGTRPEEISFEEALTRLEAVVQELEKGELSLEKALATFQEGIKLLQTCIEKLNNFEEQIEVLLTEYYSSAPSWLSNGEAGEQPR